MPAPSSIVPPARRAAPDRHAEALVTAHRHAQAALLAAIATETRGAYRAATHRAEAVTAAVRRTAGDPLADALTQETRSGVALIIALVSDDTGPSEIDRALSAHQAQRGRVAMLLRQVAAGSPKQ